MKIKKIHTKITACILSIVTLGANLPAKAVQPELLSLKLSCTTASDQFKEILTDIESDKQCILDYLEEQSDRFLKLGDGAFEIPTSTKEEMDPLILAIVLHKINDIFEEYPNMRVAFIKMLRMYGDSKFSITYEDFKESDGTNVFPIEYRPFPNYKIVINKTYFNRENARAKFINEAEASIVSGSSPRVGRTIFSMMGSMAVHEMGHLMEFLYFDILLKEENPTAFAELVDYMKPRVAIRRKFANNDPTAYDDFIALLPTQKERDASKEFFDKIRKIRIELAERRGNDIKWAISWQAGTPRIPSYYGLKNNFEFFAECFVLIEYSGGPLVSSTRTQIGIMDKEFDEFNKSET